MEIRQLRYFLKIADLGSFSRASLALGVTQPALSYQIAQLESELGHRLLHRRHSGVQLTEQGEALYGDAQRIVKQIDDLPGVVDQSADQLRATVAVGLPQGTATQFALPLLKALRHQYPGIELELFDATGDDLLRGIHARRLDIAVIVDEPDAVLVEATPLFEEELFFVTASGQAPGSSMPVARLAQVPLAVPGMQDGLRSLVEQAVRASGASLPKPSIVANSASILLQAVEEGCAGSVLPWAAVRERIKAGAMQAVPLEPRLRRQVHVCSSRDASLSLAGQAVRDSLVQVARELVESGEWRGAEWIETEAKRATRERVFRVKETRPLASGYAIGARP